MQEKLRTVEERTTLFTTLMEKIKSLKKLICEVYDITTLCDILHSINNNIQEGRDCDSWEIKGTLENMLNNEVLGLILDVNLEPEEIGDESQDIKALKRDKALYKTLKIEEAKTNYFSESRGNAMHNTPGLREALKQSRECCDEYEILKEETEDFESRNEDSTGIVSDYCLQNTELLSDIMEQEELFEALDCLVEDTMVLLQYLDDRSSSKNSIMFFFK